MGRKIGILSFTISIILVLSVGSISPFALPTPASAADGDLINDALVLVNSASASYADFEHYIQPYLDHFGVPYSVLDIATDPLGADVGYYALIIIGHRQLDPTDAYLDATEEGHITAAVNAGTGLVNFDNDLSMGGSTARYQFIEDIFGFGYVTPTTGAGVTFTSVEGGGAHQINCWEDDHQEPVLATTVVGGDLIPDDGLWTELLYLPSRDYPTLLAAYDEESSGLPVMRCYDSGIPNGEYEIFANLYTSSSGRDMRYHYGFTPVDPKANFVDTVGGTGGADQHEEYSLGTINVTDGNFDIYFVDGDILSGLYQYFGWAWIRLVPTDSPPPQMHYITERHQAGETISTGGMTMAGITLPEGVSALAMTGSQPFLAETTSGSGNAVQWGSYNWMSHSVKGPIYGLDDLVWRSIVWAARKPFVMQGLPPFITMRVDDENGPFGWIEIANEFGIKPWAGLFYYNVDSIEAAHLSTLVNSGNATAAVHAKTGSFFYYNHGVGDFSDAEIEANYAHATAWHADNNIPISKFVLPHYYEFGANVFQGLSDWGVEFVGTMMEPGNGYGAPWIMNGPYRLYEGGGSSGGRPVYYADFMNFPAQPEFENKFFNCVTEIRDDAGYEWYPSNDVAGSIGRGTRQTIRALDSMALATLFTHGYYTAGITPDNWRAILQGITEDLAPYDPIYVTMDHACQYVRAMYNSDIASSTFNPETRLVTATMGGESDMPTMFYLFTEQAGDIRHVMVDVPEFSGSTEVPYTLAGPLDHIVVTPESATVALGGTQQFSAVGFDAQENPIPNLPFTWSVVNGGGTIDSFGLFTAGVTAGFYADTVQASYGGVNDFASVNVIAPVLDHLTFEPINSPQYVGSPFQVTITARDISGNLLIGYNDTAALSDSTGMIDPTVTGSFSSGVWVGEVSIGQTAHNVTITASDGSSSGTSEPFEVQEMPMFYTVTSPSYEYLEDESFMVTVTAYQGTTINLWEDDHQDPVLATTTDWTFLETTPGEWTEYWHESGRPFPSVMAAHNEYEDYGLPLMRFYASGIPNGEYEVIANLYESAPMRYFYGFTPGDPFAHYVDTPGGAPGTQHREYSLGTVPITDGTFNLYVQDADILGGTYPIFGWAWVRLVPVSSTDININLWEDDHQAPILVPFTNPSLLNDHDGIWDEFDYPSRDYPSVMAGHNEWELNGLQPMHFFADGVPDGPYEVWANLYTGRQTRHYYGFTEAEALDETRWVDNVNGAGGANEHAEYLLGDVEITDGRFDLWAGDGDSSSPYYYGWAWIRLVPAGTTMSSSSLTMLFDADGDGTFGEPGDNVKPLVGGTFDIMARDTTAGTDITIVATDVLGRFGYNTYNILSLNQPPVANAGGPYSGDEGSPITLDASGSSDPDDNIVLYEWDLDNDGEYDDAAGVTTDVVFDDNGTFTVGLRVTDDLGESDTNTAEVTVDNVAPDVSAVPTNPTGQYSDGIQDVVFTATDVAYDTMTAVKSWSVDGGEFTDGLPEYLVLTDVGCPVSDGIRTCTWTLSGIVGVPAGTYTIRVTVTDKDGGQTETDITITVEPEDATVEIVVNPVAVRVGEDGGTGPAFSLYLEVHETYPEPLGSPAFPGDITNAQLEVSLLPVGPGGGAGPIACIHESFTDDPANYGKRTFHCEIPAGLGVNTYLVEATVGGGYYSGYAEDVLVVYDPSLGFTTGGGWFYWPDTTDRTNFGYTMKYNKKGTKVQGSLLLIRHLGDGKIYRVKSNALDGLALGTSSDDSGDFGWASFSGKSTYREPGWPDPIGNHEFVVYVEDHGEPGTGNDIFWIQVRDRDGNVIPVMSMDEPAIGLGNSEVLRGGNIVVPHDGGRNKNIGDSVEYGFSLYLPMTSQ